jgi:hypothetical protein
MLFSKTIGAARLLNFNYVLLAELWQVTFWIFHVASYTNKIFLKVKKAISFLTHVVPMQKEQGEGRGETG